MAIFKKTVFGLNVVGPQGVNAVNDFIVGETVEGETGILVGNFVVASSGPRYIDGTGKEHKIPQLPDMPTDGTKLYKLVIEGDTLRWELTDNVDVPALPADADLRHLVLKAEGGQLVWVDDLVVDSSLSIESTNPIQNQAVANAVEVLTQKINTIEGQTVRLLYSDKTNPTAEEIRQFVIDSGYGAQYWGRVAVVVAGTYHIWHCYSPQNLVLELNTESATAINEALASLTFGEDVSYYINAEYMEEPGMQWGSIRVNYTNDTYDVMWVVAPGESMQTAVGKTVESMVATSDSGLPLGGLQVYATAYTWQDDGVDTVSNFTDNSPGMIRGSSTPGYVSAQNDGTGAVVGFGDKLDKVSRNQVVYLNLSDGTPGVKGYTSEAMPNTIPSREPTLNTVAMDEPIYSQDVATKQYVDRHAVLLYNWLKSEHDNSLPTSADIDLITFHEKLVPGLLLVVRILDSGSVPEDPTAVVKLFVCEGNVQSALGDVYRTAPDGRVFRWFDYTATWAELQDDTKLDKTSQANKVYVSLSNGTPGLKGYTAEATAGTIVYRASNGYFYVLDPTSAQHPASKKYVDSGFVAKLGSGDTSRLYAVSAGGVDTYKTYDSDVSNGSIVARNNSGYFNVKAPTSNAHPATKKYVDDAVSGATGGPADFGTAVAVNLFTVDPGFAQPYPLTVHGYDNYVISVDDYFQQVEVTLDTAGAGVYSAFKFALYSTYGGSCTVTGSADIKTWDGSVALSTLLSALPDSGDPDTGRSLSFVVLKIGSRLVLDSYTTSY